MKVCGSTVKLQLKLAVLSTVEVGGIRGVAVKCLDITKNSDCIALEFHGWQLVYNVETLRRLRSEVGDDILGVNLDPSHLFWMGADPVEVARALADCIYHVHIKDVRLEPAAGQNTLLDTKGVLEFASRSWNFVTPGTGHDAAWWRRFLETLRDCGYDGALSIEQEDYTIPLEEALQKAVSLLRQALPA